MVFGLFSSRKREQKEDAPSQLRTPSPSVADKQSSPVREPPQTPSPPPDTPHPTGLWTFIQTIPPQTFHSYTLSRLLPSHTHPVSPETVAHLSAFFADLQPPPQLHCVRCHKGFFEIENTDRSCLVPHDDESAEVERVSSKAKGKGTQYETLYHCCGKTVEGDGDMGPPDGWCYEGQHTTDPKRARFRADSTMHDDKLVSCERLRCGMPPRSSRTARKRGRPVADEGEEDEDAQSSLSSHPSASTSPRSSNGASNGRKKPRTQSESKPKQELESSQMDVDAPSGSGTAPATPPSPKPKPKSSPRPKPQSRAKPKSTAASKLSTTPMKSSPLVLAPPFVSRDSSPERPSTAHVIKSSMAPPASPGPGRARKDSASSAKATSVSVSASVSASASTPERTRKDSSASSKSRSRAGGKATAKPKSKDLGEVVDSSVDAERASGWTPGA